MASITASVGELRVSQSSNRAPKATMYKSIELPNHWPEENNHRAYHTMLYALSGLYQLVRVERYSW